ncbi:MAG: WYL domain-containing protein, partial [Firmicutes bacterium]|nr:WYL domain-containing protein [Bacillota bacterium]
ITRIDADHFRTVVSVAVSSQFLGWIMALGSGIKIVAPDSVVERMKAEAKRLSEQYK